LQSSFVDEPSWPIADRFFTSGRGTNFSSALTNHPAARHDDQEIEKTPLFRLLPQRLDQAELGQVFA
jgi:hypothetical protein